MILNLKCSWSFIIIIIIIIKLSEINEKNIKSIKFDLNFKVSHTFSPLALIKIQGKKLVKLNKEKFSDTDGLWGFEKKEENV